MTLPAAVYLVVAKDGIVFGVHIQKNRAKEAIRKARLCNVWGWELKTPPKIVTYVPGRIMRRS